MKIDHSAYLKLPIHFLLSRGLLLIPPGVICRPKSLEWRRASGRHSRSRRRAVVGHVRLDEVASSQGRTQGQFERQNRPADDASKLASVLPRRRRMGSANTEELEHRTLRLEDRPAAQGADFERGHGHGNLKGSSNSTYYVISIKPTFTAAWW